MQKKNCFPYMRQHLLLNALEECLPKILHIFETTLTKLLLHMDSEVEHQKPKNCANESVKKIKTETDESLKMDLSNESLELNSVEERNDRFEKRLRLAHSIMDLLNTIEAGSKTSVIRTTEVMSEYHKS